MEQLKGALCCMKLGLYWPEENMLTETLSGVIMVMENDWPITYVMMKKSKRRMPCPALDMS